jgi:hypothetical protein
MNWSEVNFGMTRQPLLAFAASGTNLFVGTGSAGIYRSTDNGISWSSVVTGLTDLDVRSLAASGATLFAGSNSGGVYRSTDAGTSWSRVNLGLTNTSVQSLAADASNIYAGFALGGIWRRLLSDMVTSVPPSVGEAPQVFSLAQNYPNPFNPSTTVRYALPSRALVVLSVYNTLGQQVTTLVNETQDPGYHDARFDGSNLASGVYFYRLQAGDFVATKRLLLLR